MKKMLNLWNKVSYELGIFLVVLVQFITTRAYDVDAWSAPWNVLDYSMGNGSRLLVGSIYRLFYGDYLDQVEAYRYNCVGIIIGIVALSLVFGRMIRMVIAYTPEKRNVTVGMVILYLAAPFSMSYLWNNSNIGRLDTYLFLVGMLSLLVMLCIKNIYVKMLLVTVLGVIGLAVHQAYAFIYYPMIVAVMCSDVFGEYKVNVKNLVMAALSGLIEIVAFLYFQFGGGLYYDHPQAVVEVLSQRTDLPLPTDSIELEYFRDITYVQNTLLRSFFAEEKPFLQLAVVCFLLAPVIIIYVLMWKDVFAYNKREQKKLFCGPYVYVLLTNLVFVPIFAMQTDWGRWLAPLFAGQIFIFLFYLAKKDAAMYYAASRMWERVKKAPLAFIAAIMWVGTLDSFGARSFQQQAWAVIYFFTHGFHQ